MTSQAQNQPNPEQRPEQSPADAPSEPTSDMEQLLRGDDEALRKDYLDARSALIDKLASTPSSAMQPWMRKLQEDMDAESAEIRRVEEQLEREERDAAKLRSAEAHPRHRE